MESRAWERKKLNAENKNRYQVGSPIWNPTIYANLSNPGGTRSEYPGACFCRIANPAGVSRIILQLKVTPHRSATSAGWKATQRIKSCLSIQTARAPTMESRAWECKKLNAENKNRYQVGSPIWNPTIYANLSNPGGTRSEYPGACFCRPAGVSPIILQLKVTPHRRATSAGWKATQRIKSCLFRQLVLPPWSPGPGNARN